MCFSARAVYFIHGPPYSASQEPERVSVRKDKYERTRARLDKEEGRDRVARRQARAIYPRRMPWTVQGQVLY